MGMPSDTSPRYLSVNSSGQVTYVLETGNLNFAQLQLAVPGSEVVLIQEEGKSVNLSDSPILVAEVGTENFNWLGNNVIVLVSQPQEVMIVDSDMIVDTNSGNQWFEDSTEGASALMPLSHIVTKMLPVNSTEEWSTCIIHESTPAVEDAQCWFRDSLITATALSSLSSYVQSHAVSKDE